MSQNRIDQLSTTHEGPRQTPNDAFGLTLAKTLAKGTSGVMGIAAPILGGVNPVLSAPVSSAASVISSFATSSGATVPRMAVSVPSTGTSTTSTSTSTNGSSSESSLLSSSDSSDPMALVQAQKDMNTQSQEFNMMYLNLQDTMQRESREYETISNIMKVRHDTAKNAISNIH